METKITKGANGTKVTNGNKVFRVNVNGTPKLNGQTFCSPRHNS